MAEKRPTQVISYIYYEQQQGCQTEQSENG